MEPEEAEMLEILPEKDLCTLITCTPYGINTQRLVVTGERVPYEKIAYNNIQKKLPSFREIFFMVFPFTFMAIGPYEKIAYNNIQKKLPSFREIFFMVFPFTFMAIGLVTFLRRKGYERKNK